MYIKYIVAYFTYLKEEQISDWKGPLVLHRVITSLLQSYSTRPMLPITPLIHQMQTQNAKT